MEKFRIGSATPWVRLIGPAEQEIGVLPPITFIWNPRMLGDYFPPGAFYAGTEVQAPILDPFQCIQRIVIPRYKRQLAAARIVKQDLLPELAAAGRQKYPEYRDAVFQGGKTRFENSEKGVAVEEDVCVLTGAVRFPVGPTISTMWAPDEIRYSKASKGTLDSQMLLFQTVMFGSSSSLVQANLSC
jgi:hypothetical protein